MVRYHLDELGDEDGNVRHTGRENAASTVSLEDSIHTMEWEHNVEEIDEVPVEEDNSSDDCPQTDDQSSVKTNESDEDEGNNHVTDLAEYSGSQYGAPIIREHHYHIYYTPPPEYYDDNDRPSCCSRGCCFKVLSSWWLFALLAIGFHMVRVYGPPAPPNQSSEPHAATSWPEFWNTQLDHVLSLAKTAHQLPSHVSYWCWQGIREDVSRLIFASGRMSDRDAQNCQWTPELLQGGEGLELPLYQQRVSEEFRRNVVGQDEAIDMVMQALMTNRGDRSPILLYLTGGVAVGKTHLAKTLSRLAFFAGHFKDWCKFDDAEDTNPGLFFRAAEHANDANETQLLTRIQEHVTRASREFGGAVIVITHVEALPSGLFAALVRQLDYYSFGSTDAGSSAPDQHMNIIVVFTSNVGARVLRKSIQMYGRTSIPPLELRNFLSYQIDRFHESSATDMPMSSLLDAIIPMFPLGKTELRFILRDEVKRKLNVLQKQKYPSSARTLQFQPMQGVLDAWLEHVEFHTWLQKSTERAIMTFSPAGATPVLSDSVLVSNLASQLMENCEFGNAEEAKSRQRPADDNVVLTVATSNYDSSDSGQLHFIAQVCTSPQGKEDAEGSSRCSEECRFLI